MKWEYLCQRFVCDSSDLEEGLDVLGEDEWELVEIEKIRATYSSSLEIFVLFFKRPKRETPASLETKSICLGDASADDSDEPPDLPFPVPGATDPAE